MKNSDVKINDRKLRGEWAEMYFMACAAEHGLHVNKPYGEMSHFDFIIGDCGCLLRVQVKSTLARKSNGYDCSVRGGHRAYVGDVFDFLAVLVIPERTWYIIPAELILGKSSIVLRPSLPSCKFAPYREAWHLLRPRACALRGTIGHIEASADTMADSVPGYWLTGRTADSSARFRRALARLQAARNDNKNGREIWPTCPPVCANLRFVNRM